MAAKTGNISLELWHMARKINSVPPSVSDPGPALIGLRVCYKTGSPRPTGKCLSVLSGDKLRCDTCNLLVKVNAQSNNTVVCPCPRKLLLQRKEAAPARDTNRSAGVSHYLEASAIVYGAFLVGLIATLFCTADDLL